MHLVIAVVNIAAVEAMTLNTTLQHKGVCVSTLLAVMHRVHAKSIFAVKQAIVKLKNAVPPKQGTNIL